MNFTDNMVYVKRENTISLRGYQEVSFECVTLKQSKYCENGAYMLFMLDSLLFRLSMPFLINHAKLLS